MYYSFNQFSEDIKRFSIQIRDEFNPDAIVAIARGGVTLSHFLAVALENRNLFALNSIHYDGKKKLDDVKLLNIPDLCGYKRVLVVDDIVDSGESLSKIKEVLQKSYPECEIRIATIFYKKKAIIKPDFWLHLSDDWVHFFWDISI